MFQETEKLQELRQDKTRQLEERHTRELEDFDNDTDPDNYSTASWKLRSISSVSSLSNLSSSSSISASSAQGTNENNGALRARPATNERLTVNSVRV